MAYIVSVPLGLNKVMYLKVKQQETTLKKPNIPAAWVLVHIIKAKTVYLQSDILS
jgi:hypothetical protein